MTVAIEKTISPPCHSGTTIMESLPSKMHTRGLFMPQHPLASSLPGLSLLLL
ncbi:hypothetical protein [Ktedonosporobacter rubrisoli]|uniref:hypothetical protein n=1 Tax=Ktedonosporobacter rubrisoli TaxID=2509675 RepID=UPI0013EEC02C|nr:hypothetical protein [Ktedonosporobacter rubrisoli]